MSPCGSLGAGGAGKRAESLTSGRRRISGDVLHAAATTGGWPSVDERSAEERVSCVERGDERCGEVRVGEASTLRLVTRVVLGDRLAPTTSWVRRETGDG